MLLKKARRKGFRGCIHSTLDQDILTRGFKLRDAGKGELATGEWCVQATKLHVPDVAVSNEDLVN